MSDKIIPKKIETLLSDLRERDFKALIDLEELKGKGWRLHYIIDAAVIGYYCFPNGILSYNQRKAMGRQLTNEYLFDEQATFYYHFSDKKSGIPAIVLDDYVVELKSMTRVAQMAIKNGAVNNNRLLNEGQNKIAMDKVTFSELREQIEDDLCLRLSEITIGTNGLERFYKLLSQKELVFENDESIEPLFRKIFDEEKGNKPEIEIIYDFFEFRDSRKPFNSESRDRDSRAIQRVLSINRRLQIEANRENAKNIFLFVTDAPSVMQEVWDKVVDSSNIAYPLINGKRIPFYITTQSLFASIISGNSDLSDVDQPQDRIRELTDLRDKSLSIQESLKQVNYAIAEISGGSIQGDLLVGEYGKFFSKYRSLRNKYENIGFFKNLKTIYASVQRDLKAKNDQQLIKFFDEAYKNQDKLLSEFKGRDKILKELVVEVDLNAIYIAGIEEIKYNGDKFEWSKGEDEIEGTYQILPVFLQANMYSNYQNDLNKIIRLVLQERSIEEPNVYDDFKKLISSLSQVRSMSDYNIYERLLKTLIFLILPDLSSDNLDENVNKRGKDWHAYEWLTRINNKGEKIREYKADLLYMLCWVTRRMKRYQESVHFSEDGIRHFPKDPRFYHGLALAQYCTFAQEARKTQIEIDLVISNMDTAGELYPDFFRKYYSQNEASLYLSRINDCISNSNCFFLTEKAFLLFDEDQELAVSCLQKARKRLNNLRIIIDKKPVFKVVLPEYFDTEANLEYFESFFDEDYDIEKKINSAAIAISKAINLCSNEALVKKYISRREKIENRQKELRRKS